MKITRRAIKASTASRRSNVTAAYDKTRQKLQDACEGFIGRKADDVLDELDSMGFSDHSSSPVREDGEVVGRREVFWSSSYDTDIVIEYDKQTEEVYNAYTEETKDNQAGVGSATKTAKRPIRAARTETIQYLNFDELSDEQKDQAVKIFMESDTANRWFDDDMMDFYHDRVSEFAGALYDNTGIKVDTKKLYWGSSSQGPYPEWKLDEVLGDYDDNNGVSASFYGSLDAKFDTILIEEMGDFIATGNQEFYDTKEIRDAGMPEIADQLDEVLAAVQAFVDAVWSEVNDVCTSYPDEEWCYGVLEANNYEFRVDDAGNVVSMA